MALTVMADFVDLPNSAKASLAFVPKPRAGHVRVDVVHASAPKRAKKKISLEPDAALVPHGVHRCPCEIDLQLSEVLERLAARGVYAFDFFVEPLVDDAPLRLDVDLQSSADGESWASRTVVKDCRPGTIRTSHVAETFGEKLRLKMRFVGEPESASIPVRVWLRNPGRG